MIGIINSINAIGNKIDRGDHRWGTEVPEHHLSSITRSKITGGRIEWKTPEMGALAFSSSFEDADSCGTNDINVIFGKNNFAALVGKWAQADEGMGK